jgi:hypothetical protein
VDNCEEVLGKNGQLKECDRLKAIKLSSFIQACHSDCQVHFKLVLILFLNFSFNRTKRQQNQTYGRLST